MNRKKSALILVLLTIILSGACLNLKKPRNKIEYYTLEYEAPTIAHLEPTNAIIRTARFSVAPIYSTNRIIYRDSSFQRDAYVYHKWRANPGELVTYFLRRDIRESGLFKAVIDQQSDIPSLFYMEGSVEDFLEWDTEEGWQAVLSVSISLMNEMESELTKKIAFQKSYTTNKPCSSRNPRALAEAMSMAMKEISEKIIMDIHGHLNNTERGPD